LLDRAKREAYDRQFNQTALPVQQEGPARALPRTSKTLANSAVLIGLTGGGVIALMLMVGAVIAFFALRDAGDRPPSKAGGVWYPPPNANNAAPTGKATKNVDAGKATTKQANPKAFVDTTDSGDPSDGLVLPLKPGLNVGKPCTWRTGPVLSLAILPDSRRLLIGSFHKVLLWDSQSGKAVVLRERGGGWQVTIDKLGKHAAIRQMNAKVVDFWDLDQRQSVGTLTASDDISSVAISPDGQRVLTTGGHFDQAIKRFVDTDLRVWDFATQTEVGRWQGHRTPAAMVGFFPEGGKAISVANDDFRVWDVKQGMPLHQFSVGKSTRGLALSPEGRYLAVGGEQACRLVDTTTYQEVALYTVASDSRIFFHVPTFSPSGKYLASGATDGQVRIHDARDLTVLATLPVSAKWIHGLAFAPNGKYLAAGGDNDTYVWALAESPKAEAKTVPPATAGQDDTSVNGRRTKPPR
jgi:WD domain, G-beta repeat